MAGTTLYLVQHRFQIIRLLEHSPRLQCQEPGGDETSAFDHICRDASPGYEGRGRTGTMNKKTIFTLTRSSWLNCALRDDEAVYWVSIGHYEAVAVGN